MSNIFLHTRNKNHFLAVISAGFILGLLFVLLVFPFSGEQPNPRPAYAYEGSGGKVSDSSDRNDSRRTSVIGYGGGVPKQIEIESYNNYNSSDNSEIMIGYGGSLLENGHGALGVLEDSIDILIDRLDESIDEFSMVSDPEHNFRKFNTPFTITGQELFTARNSVIRRLVSEPLWAGENLEYVKSISNLEMSKLRHSNNTNDYDFFAYGGMSITVTVDQNMQHFINDLQVSGYCENGGDVCSVAVDFRKASRSESPN